MVYQIIKIILPIASAVAFIAYIVVRIWFRQQINDDIADYILWVGSVSLSIFLILVIKDAEFSNVAKSRINTIGLLVALITGAFGVWGYFSSAGSKLFDEMDAMYPFFSLMGSVGIFVMLLFLNVVWWVKAR